MTLCFEAVCAGLCAALASLFAKLAMASQKVPDICHGFLQASHYNLEYSDARDGEDQVKVFAQTEDFCSSVSDCKIFI